MTDGRFRLDLLAGLLAGLLVLAGLLADFVLAPVTALMPPASCR
ncbi:MAG: hypothetical protein ACRDN0_09145 [Trebonia sp.]